MSLLWWLKKTAYKVGMLFIVLIANWYGVGTG